jgi:hypothetical protein
MKYILIATLALASLSSFANMEKKHEEMMKKMDSMSFEDAKKWKSDMLMKKQSMIQEEQSCVNSSKDKAGLKKCSEDMHAKMDQMMMDSKKKM